MEDRYVYYCGCTGNSASCSEHGDPIMSRNVGPSEDAKESEEPVTNKPALFGGGSWAEVYRNRIKGNA